MALLPALIVTMRSPRVVRRTKFLIIQPARVSGGTKTAAVPRGPDGLHHAHARSTPRTKVAAVDYDPPKYTALLGAGVRAVARLVVPVNLWVGRLRVIRPSRGRRRQRPYFR
jgi:hypothetical protein